MAKLIGLALLAVATWWTGGFGLVALAQHVVAAWIAAAPMLFEAGLLLAWLWGLIYVPAVRKLTFGLLKLTLVIVSFGLLLGLLSHTSDDDAAAMLLMD